VSDEMPLRVVAEYGPAGDQPAAIERLAAGVREGVRYQTLLGVTGSGKTFTMAKVVEAVQRPTLIMAPNKTLAAQLASEMHDLLPDNAVVYFVSYYDYYQPEAYVPSTDTFIEKDSSINEEVEKLRHAATASLLSRRDVVVVASVSCIYGIGSPEEYAGQAVFLKAGAALDRQDLVRQLIDIHYDRNDYDLTRGSFRVRGDVIDIFPPYADRPLRVEFYGDEIEQIAEVDLVTGEVATRMRSVPVWPATHYVTAPERLQAALEAIRAELDERLRVLRADGKLLEAQRLEMRTNYDLEMLETMGFCSGIENYSRHLDGREPGDPPNCLIDYFPDDFLTFVDESHVTIPQVRGMYEGDRSRKLTLVEHGFRLPSALDNRPLRFDEFEKRVPQFVYVSATPGDYEVEKSRGHVVEQIIRPTGLVDPEVVVRPTRGQIDDLVAEVRELAAKDERVLVTTLTKKMAEDLTDYMLEQGLRTRYLHADVPTMERVELLRDLRAGVYDCLVGINLLREGLDLPEVTLVAILDADKAGFLRNHRSLIQTIGRAARNVSGRVIMYAEDVTESMRLAIDETNRRRAIQVAYNLEHGIEPQSIRKAIHAIVDYARSAEGTIDAEEVARELSALPREEVLRLIATLEEDMTASAEALDFESAARLRDQVVRLRAQVESTPEGEVLERLKQGARKGSAHGVRKRKR
jgi:excinuclease ABC subunit B